MSCGPSERAEPIWAASWPSSEAQMPSSPWRCKAIASVSILRTRTRSRYMSLMSAAESSTG